MNSGPNPKAEAYLRAEQERAEEQARKTAESGQKTEAEVNQKMQVVIRTHVYKVLQHKNAHEKRLPHAPVPLRMPLLFPLSNQLQSLLFPYSHPASPA